MTHVIKCISGVFNLQFMIKARVHLTCYSRLEEAYPKGHKVCHSFHTQHKIYFYLIFPKLNLFRQFIMFLTNFKLNL